MINPFQFAGPSGRIEKPRASGVKCSCTIVVPCYNEEQRFPVDQFVHFFSANPEICFVLVNDGSKDSTLAVLRSAAAGHEDQVEVLDQPVNRGKAEAVRMGMMHAMKRPECQLAGFWDADLATPLEAIQELAAVLAVNPRLAMVFGSRVKLLGRQVERKAIRHYLGRVFATVVSIVLSLAIYDTQCGAKLFRVTPEVKAIFSKEFTSRWVFDVEIIARFIQQRGYDVAAVEDAIYEFPLMKWQDVAGSRLRPKDFFRAFFDLLRIHRRYHR